MKKEYCEPIKWERYTAQCTPGTKGFTHQPESPWPDTRWRGYWQGKRWNASHTGIYFGLSIAECIQLIEIAPERPSRMGYHLGRVNHNEGYTIDNVEWQTREENLRLAEFPRPKTVITGLNRREGVPRYKDGSIVRKYRIKRKNK